MHIKKAKGSPMLSVIESNVKHKSHGHGHMGNGGVLHNGMSLFQDLKLKRRKVDSRCSSDGESIGTSDSSAASLSPEAQAQGEGSPKEKDRCQTPEEMVAPVNKTSGFPPQAFLFMMKAKEAYGPVTNGLHPILPKTNGVIKQVNGLTNGSHVMVKSEPSDEEMLETGNGPRLITVTQLSRENSPEKVVTGAERRKSPSARASSSNPSSTAGSDTESTTSRTSSVIKREKMNVPETERQRSPPPLVSLSRGTTSPGNHSNSSSSPHSSLSSSGSTLTITKQGGPRLSPNASPPQHFLSNNYRDHQMIGSQNLLHSRLTGPSPESRISSGGPHSHPVPMSQQNELRSMAEKPDPLSVVTSTSLSFHHQSPYRINGVRPEVISGGAVTPVSSANPTMGPSHTNQNTLSPPGLLHPMNGMRKSPNLGLHSRSPNASPQSNSSSSMGTGSIHSHSPNSTIVAGGSLSMGPGSSGSSGSNSHHHHVNLNRTPTVIMGEAGGVRTMLWSQPGQNLPPELGGVNHNSHSPPSTNGHYGLPPTNGHLPNHHGPMSNGGSPPHHNNNTIHHLHQKGGLSMERLWASEALNLSTSGTQGSNTTNGNSNTPNGHANNHVPNGGVNGQGIGGPHQTNGHHLMSTGHPDDDDFEQPMICMICEDRATGLHYGIITCEGCKGFFKRTVQNRRVYTCVADGTCEITKAQRNRCQYCRFKKCIEQGMVLQAVREDRMPGGRNSGAVYNLYKVPVKYRKHKKANRGVGGKPEKLTVSSNNSNSNGSSHGNGLHNGQLSNGGMTPSHGPPSQSSISGTILKAALTSPNEVNHMRQGMPFDQAAAMITHLVQCDNFHDIAALQNWEELLEARGDLSDKLCQMGDSIVYRLVQWTKRLPFYQEVPVEVHTRVLTHKWHELLVLTTSAWQAMHTPGPPTNITVEEETMENLQVLQRCLQAMMGRSLTLEQLRQDVGQMVERLTYLTRSFRRLGIRIEEYVTLKVIAMLQNTGTKSNEVAVIQERYIKCLRTFLEVTCPSHPNRLSDLLRTLPEVQAAAALLLESKMFYVPFLLNSALLQR